MTVCIRAHIQAGRGEPNTWGSPLPFYPHGTVTLIKLFYKPARDIHYEAPVTWVSVTLYCTLLLKGHPKDLPLAPAFEPERQTLYPHSFRLSS